MLANGNLQSTLCTRGFGSGASSTLPLLATSKSYGNGLVCLVFAGLYREREGTAEETLSDQALKVGHPSEQDAPPPPTAPRHPEQDLSRRPSGLLALPIVARHTLPVVTMEYCVWCTLLRATAARRPESSVPATLALHSQHALVPRILHRNT